MSFYLMHRGWLDHDVFGDDEPFCRRAAWAWLIDHAEFAARQIRIGRHVVTLRRGQLTYSLRYLADAWGWNQERVRRFLAELAARDMVVTASVTASVTAQTLVTICNYDRYQTLRPRGCDSPRDSKNDDRVTNSKEAKEEKESKKLSQPSLSPGPARAREAPPNPDPRPTPPPAAAAPPLTEAGLARLRDFKIPEEWVVAATAQRHANGQPELNVRKEADKLEKLWGETVMPRDPWRAWITWALGAWPDSTNTVEQRSREYTEEERLAGLQIALARMAEREAMEAAA